MTSINYGSLDFYGFLCLSVPSISCSLTSEEMVSHLIRCVFHFSVYKGEILHVVSSEWFLFLLQTSTLPSFPEMVSNHPFFIFFSSNISISHAYAFPAVASFLNVTIPPFCVAFKICCQMSIFILFSSICNKDTFWSLRGRAQFAQLQVFPLVATSDFWGRIALTWIQGATVWYPGCLLSQ